MVRWSLCRLWRPEPKARAAKLGRRAERAAERFLVRRGLRLVARNYRTRRGEVDLVMYHGDELVFVEVRMRSRSDFGNGAATVDRGKQSKMIRTAVHYLAHHDSM